MGSIHVLSQKYSCLIGTLNTHAQDVTLHCGKSGRWYGSGPATEATHLRLNQPPVFQVFLNSCILYREYFQAFDFTDCSQFVKIFQQNLQNLLVVKINVLVLSIQTLLFKDSSSYCVCVTSYHSGTVL